MTLVPDPADPADWIWVHVWGHQVALTPEAYAEVAGLISEIRPERRGDARHGHMVAQAAMLLEEQGWLRVQVHHTAEPLGREWRVLALVPAGERLAVRQAQTAPARRRGAAE